MKTNKKTNVQLEGLIGLLRKQASQMQVDLWKRVATDLEKSTRKRRVVNLYHIDQSTKENESIIVPGKVLGTGELGHKVQITAFDFSDGAKEKIIQAKGSCLTILELIEKNPKAKDVRVIG